MNLILLGAPGSGKGTQAARLSEGYELKHISSGDLLRAAVKKQDELGREIETIIAAGKLVPDQTVLRLVREAILENEDNRWEGWMLDGYPRTADQAEALEDVLSSAREVVDSVVFLDVDADEVVKRLSNRRICPNCNTVYNLLNRPPKVEGKCDNSDGDLIRRVDDEPDTIRKRLEVYEKETLPILDFYEQRYDVHRITGTGSIEAITQNIVETVGL